MLIEQQELTGSLVCKGLTSPSSRRAEAAKLRGELRLKAGRAVPVRRKLVRAIDEIMVDG